MHKQQVNGNMPTRESRRKAKNRVKKPISAHTRRFRTLYVFDPDAINILGGRGCKVPAGESAPIRVK